MTIQFFSGFEAGENIEWASVTGSPSWSTAQKKTGAYALRCNPSATTAYATNGLADGSMDRGSFWLYIASAPTSDCRIIGSASGASLYLTPSQINGVDYTGEGVNGVAPYGSNWYCGTFTAGSTYTITSIGLRLARNGTTPGTITVSIRATSGGLPTGADLCSGTYDGSTIPTGTPVWISITLGAGTSLSSGVTYAVIFRAPSGDSSNNISVRYLAATGQTVGFSSNSGVDWSSFFQ